MSNAAIKAALAAAKMPIAAGKCSNPTTCVEDTGAPCYCEKHAAEIVAAFLRALPPGKTLARFDRDEGRVRQLHTDDLHVLADQIERAAIEEAARDA